MLVAMMFVLVTMIVAGAMAVSDPTLDRED
jgi:hypothetical protein